MPVNAKVQPSRPLREAYPHLWEWVSRPSSRNLRSGINEIALDQTIQSALNSDDVQHLVSDNFLRIDLEGSLTDLTRRLAKSKTRPTPRLKTLGRWDAALELRSWRAGANKNLSSINEVLRTMCPDTQRLNELLHPTDPETQIHRELVLGCCVVGSQQSFDAGAPERALKQLEDLNLDSRDVYILRNVLIALNSVSPDTAAETLGVTRQTVWNRGNVILKKMETLRNHESVVKIFQIVDSYRRVPTSSSEDGVICLIDDWNIAYDTRDPMIGHLTSPSSGSFPQYRDLWQVVVFLTSKESGPSTPERPSGFTRGQDGIIPSFPGREYHLFTQDLVPTFFDSEFDADSGKIVKKLGNKNVGQSKRPARHRKVRDKS